MVDIAPSLTIPPWQLTNQDGGPPPSLVNTPTISFNDTGYAGISARVLADEAFEAEADYRVRLFCLAHGSGSLTLDLGQSSSYLNVTGVGYYDVVLTMNASVATQMIGVLSNGAIGIVITKPVVEKIS